MQIIVRRAILQVDGATFQLVGKHAAVLIDHLIHIRAHISHMMGRGNVVIDSYVRRLTHIKLAIILG